MFKLHSQFKPAGDQPKAIKKLLKGLSDGDRYQTLLGVTGSGKTFTVSNIIEKIQKPTLIIAPNKTLAAQLYREYKNFFPENVVCYFVSYYDYYQPEAYMPVTDTYIGKEAMINEEIDKLRHVATSALMTRKDVIVVASVSCIYNLGVPENYLGSSLHLEVGKLITRGDLIKQFVKMQFERNNVSLERGSFRVRGDVFEIVPAYGEVIYRIGLKDQKISELSIIDKTTRKIKEELNELVIFPPKHFVTTEPERLRAIKDIKDELKERLKYFNRKGLLLEAERLERRTKYDLEMIKEVGYCHGIENYSRMFSGKLAGDPPDSLLAYFGKPNDFLTIIDESHIAVPQVQGMYEGDRSRKQTLIDHGFRLPSALDNRPLKFAEFEKRIGQTIFTSATPGNFEYKNSSQIAEQIIRPTGLIDPEIEIRPVFETNTKKSQIDDIMEEIEKTIKIGGRIIVNALTKKMSEELSEFLQKERIKNKWLHSDVKTFERTRILTEFRNGVFDVLIGVNLLREGLDLPEVMLVAILDADREGFLRSETSLMQTMGRAARNDRGRVILYADTITGSIKRALDECDRRRKIQLTYNRKHGIIPKTIEKKVEEML